MSDKEGIAELRAAAHRGHFELSADVRDDLRRWSNEMERLTSDAAYLRRALLYVHWARTGCATSDLSSESWVCARCKIDFSKMTGRAIAEELGRICV